MRRATTTQRGYGSGHKRMRAQWAPKVATGTVTCWRCGELIAPDDPWDLGHDDDDRSIYRGPEHAGPCNRSAAAKRSNRRRAKHRSAAQRPRLNPSRRW